MELTRTETPPQSGKLKLANPTCNGQIRHYRIILQIKVMLRPLEIDFLVNIPSGGLKNRPICLENIFKP